MRTTTMLLGLLLAASATACTASSEPGATAGDESDFTSDKSGGDVALLQAWIGETAGRRYDSGPQLGDKALDPSLCTGTDCSKAAQSVYDSWVVGPFAYDFDHSGQCESIEIRTVIRESALKADSFRGIGLHLSTVDGPVLVDKAVLEGQPFAGRVTLADGEPGVVHRFVTQGMCFGLGGNSGSINARNYELKPFAAFAADGNDYRVWEDSKDNLRLGRQKDGSFLSKVDRQDELLEK